MAASLTMPDQTVARDLREQIAPVFANGVTCALRDQPADPAGYMAEYLAAAGAGGALSLSLTLVVRVPEHSSGFETDQVGTTAQTSHAGDKLLCHSLQLLQKEETVLSH